MRTFFRVVLCVSVLTACLSATPIAPTIQFEVGVVGTGVDRYTYFVSGLTLQANEEIDLEFSANLFGVLSNPVVGGPFQVLLFQPNNPLGAPGDFSVAATSDNTVVTGPLSVDFTFTGPGTPGSQLFQINQFDANGKFVGLIASGNTSQLATAVPEPHTSDLILLALALAGFSWVRQGRSSRGIRGEQGSFRVS